jgi:hypothetical protein
MLTFATGAALDPDPADYGDIPAIPSGACLPRVGPGLGRRFHPEAGDNFTPFHGFGE